MDEITAIIVAERCFSIIMLGIIVNLLGKPEKKKTNIYLALTAAFSLVGLITDSLTYQIENWDDLGFSYYINYLIYFLAYSTYNGLLLFFTLYCKAYIEERTTINKWFFRFPIIIYTIAYIYQLINIIQDKLFFYDGTKFLVYSNSLPPVILVVSVISAVYLPAVTLYKAKEIGKMVTALLTLTIILPLATLISELISDPNLDYSPVTTALGIFIAYLFMQNKQEHESTEKRIINEEYQHELEILNSDLKKAQHDIDDYIEKLLAERQIKEDYYRISRYDATTNVYRKNAFLEEVKVFFELNRPVTAGVIFIDIDDFKNVNDNLGHVKGDEAIAQIAEILRTSVANKDLIGRYGGDEFVVLMKDITKAKLIDKLEFLHKKFQLDVSKNNKHMHVTCSIGAIYYKPELGKVTVDELMEQADKCLYKVKESGRDSFDYADYKGL